MDRPPSNDEIKEFWEKVGFLKQELKELAPNYRHEANLGWWIPCSEKSTKTLPPIDLNTLFKFAVPKVIDKIMAKQECSSDLAYAILFKKWLQKLELDIPQYEATLFSVLWEVIHD